MMFLIFALGPLSGLNSPGKSSGGCSYSSMGISPLRGSRQAVLRLKSHYLCIFHRLPGCCPVVAVALPRTWRAAASADVVTSDAGSYLMNDYSILKVREGELLTPSLIWTGRTKTFGYFLRFFNFFTLPHP